MDLKELGQKIAKIRTAKGLSAYELSLRIGKDTSYFYKVESGKVNISYTVLCDICKVLEISPKELF
jgi:transcriptional regulator with XRE-family HTH domain